MSLTLSQLKAIQQAIDESIPAVLVTVIEVKGSAPRGVGTAMLVQANTIVGTIGGGRLEYEAIVAARARANDSKTSAFEERYPLGASLGQCCGGSVTLLFERIENNWTTWLEECLTAWQQRKPYRREVNDRFTHQIEPPQANLVLCGAGHVGRAVVSVLRDVPIHIHWADERGYEFPANVPDNTQVEVTDTADAVIEAAPAGSAVIVTTHRHDLDFSLTETALLRSDLAYVGLIGSTSKRSRFERLMQQRHGDSFNLQQLTCPIGMPGLNSKEPSVLAIAVAAEILPILNL